MARTRQRSRGAAEAPSDSSPDSVLTPPEEDASKENNDAQDEKELEEFWVDEATAKEEHRAEAERAKRDERERKAAAEARARKALAGMTPAEIEAERLSREQAVEALLDQANAYASFLRDNLGKDVEDVANELGGLDDDGVDEQIGVGAKRSASGSSSGQAPAKKTKTDDRSPTKKLLPLMEGELRPYQLKGVSWLVSLYRNGMNGMLADEMGLGKTVQTIGLLSFLRSQDIHGPFLIVAPLSTLSNWEDEMARWCPSLKALVFHGTKKDRQVLLQGLRRQREKNLREMKRKGSANRNDEFRDFPVIITSFEMAIKERADLSKFGTFKCLVVDEAHRLKNSNCLLVRELSALSVELKVLLTGTPLQNNLAELWSLLHFMLPNVFTNVSMFEASFDFSALVGSDVDPGVNEQIVAAEAKEGMVRKLHSILHPFMMRRIKAEVEASLPAKQEIVMYAPMTPLQSKLCDQLTKKDFLQEAMRLQKESGKPPKITQLRQMLMQLRKTCNHPDLITREWEHSPHYPPAEELVQQCGKMQLLNRLLLRLKSKGHKVLIFSQFTSMLDLLDSYIEDMGWMARRIDGNVSLNDRRAHMKQFNSDPECFIFLLSTRAGGLGINLTSADTVIIYDSDWNPHMDMQAMDRAHRLGQSKPVLVLRLCTSESVEGRLLKRAQSKLALERLVIKKGAFQGADSRGAGSQLSAAELLEALTGPALKLGKGAQSACVDDAMLDKILDRTHLAAKSSCPYPAAGPGYELVVQQESSLLAGVQ